MKTTYHHKVKCCGSCFHFKKQHPKRGRCLSKNKTVNMYYYCPLFSFRYNLKESKLPKLRKIRA